MAIEANFTQDCISKIHTDYFYIAPLLSITYLLIAFFCRGWIQSRPLGALQFELTLWHFIFTVFCSTGFWILAFPIIEAIKREGLVYAPCTNLITDNPWLSLWSLLTLLLPLGDTLKCFKAGRKDLLFQCLFHVTVFLFSWYGLASKNSLTHWHFLILFSEYAIISFYFNLMGRYIFSSHLDYV